MGSSLAVCRAPNIGGAQCDRADALDNDLIRTTETTPLAISHVLPNPEGADRGAETVTIVNLSLHEVDLAGWSIRDDDGGSMDLSGTLGPGASLQVTLVGAGVPVLARVAAAVSPSASAAP